MFGGIATIVSAFAGYAQAFPVGLEAHALMWTVAGTFWLLYLRVVHLRWSWYKRVDIFTLHGPMIILNGFKTDKKEIEAAISTLVGKWTAALAADRQHLKGRTSLEVVLAAIGVRNTAIDPVLVTFDKGDDDTKLIPHPTQRNIKVFGYTLGRSSHVGFRSTSTLDQTAFTHELGHMVHREYFGRGDEAEEHAFISKHGLD